MKERIKAIEEYLKYYPYDINAKDNLSVCQYADELDIKLNGNYYPRMNWDYCLINSQIKVGKKYFLTNSKTKYECNGKDTIVIWSASAGRLDFVSDAYWWDIENEWNDFMNILKLYNPLDYDEINNNYIYDLENGKKLIKDYNKIVEAFKDKVLKKIKEVDLANKRKELERLQKELEREE